MTLWQAQQLIAGRTSGYKVDRYVLLDLIGQGGMGRVYLARDTRLNRRVALKILSPDRMNNPRAIARFQREGRVGAQLQHENLVRIYDFGESLGRYYLVMEYIEGKTIGTLLAEQGPMPATTAARLVRQVALGLEHAHRKGLIHRDVNPYNILITHDGTAKLADLGLAIDLADQERVTRDGATVGTFDYVAPEQARHSHTADIRSDIYSLGCTFYHMLTGQVPFPVPSLPEKLFAHQTQEPAPVTELVADLPAGLGEVVERMMKKLPEDRYATPLQVAQALEHIDGVPTEPGEIDGRPRSEKGVAVQLQVEVARAVAAATRRGFGGRPRSGSRSARGRRWLSTRRRSGPLGSNRPVPSPRRFPPLLTARAAIPTFSLTWISAALPRSAKALHGPSQKPWSIAHRAAHKGWLPPLPLPLLSSRVRLWGLAGLGMVALITSVILAVTNPFGCDRGDRATGPPPVTSKVEPAPKSRTGTAPELKNLCQNADRSCRSSFEKRVRKIELFQPINCWMQCKRQLEKTVGLSCGTGNRCTWRVSSQSIWRADREYSGFAPPRESRPSSRSS